jgi:hypothetical protein
VRHCFKRKEGRKNTGREEGKEGREEKKEIMKKGNE